MKNQSDWLNRADYTAEQRRDICIQLLSEAQYWDSSQYQKMMSDSTKRPWVDLTDREMMDAIDIDDSPMEMGRKIEAKLKERT